MPARTSNTSWVQTKGQGRSEQTAGGLLGNTAIKRDGQFHKTFLPKIGRWVALMAAGGRDLRDVTQRTPARLNARLRGLAGAPDQTGHSWRSMATQIQHERSEQTLRALKDDARKDMHERV